MNKIGVIGCGNVGLSIIHNIEILNWEIEIKIIDNNKERTLSNIIDFNHMLSSTKLSLSEYNDLDDCKILIISSGIKYNKNRTVFLKESYLMINKIMKNIKKTKFSGIIIVVSNPCDVLTTFVAKNYDKNKVIGMGCMLDTNRLKNLLGLKYQINPHFIDATIVGEHGTMQKIIWDKVKINNKNIALSNDEKKYFEECVKDAASEIVKGKGYTNYGISSCVVYLIEHILSFKEKEFRFIGSLYNSDYDVSYSYPLIYDGNVFKYDNLCDIDDDMDFCINKIKKEYFIFQNDKVIGIDLDDTITDIQDDMKYYASIFDKENNGLGIVNKDKYLVGEMYNWNLEMKEKFFSTYRKIVIEKAKVRKNVSKIFHKWQDLGYKIVIITARNEKYYTNPYEYSYKWLKKHHIPFDLLVVNSSDKKKICQKYGVNYFIDDMPSNCLSVNEINKIKVFIMDNGNNLLDNKNIIRVKNFEEIDEVIENV